LDAFGLPQEFGTYGKIRGLSGGQKVKLVLAAAFWTVPHLVGKLRWILESAVFFCSNEYLTSLIWIFSESLQSWTNLQIS
jgi:hypothetical protein